jgi:hypothetical protein
VLYVVLHMNVLLSEVIFSDLLEQDHLPIVFLLLDLVRTMNLSDTVDQFTDWERLQMLAAELISPRIQINSRKDLRPLSIRRIDYRQNKITISNLNNDLPGQESLLKHKRR